MGGGADYALCHIGADGNGNTLINDTFAALSLAFAGITVEKPTENCLYIVVPRDFNIPDGYYLAVNGGKPLLKWNEGAQRFNVCESGLLGVSDRVELWRPLKSALLTVSDKCSRGERKDTAGPALASMMRKLGFEVQNSAAVPDDKGLISEYVLERCDDEFNFVALTGGTGLSERDVTPEVLESIAEKTVPGFGEMMRMQTLKYTDRAFLTRSVAVIRGKTLIVAFPGSERAVRQCFEAVSGGLRHGVEILAGYDTECGGHNH